MKIFLTEYVDLATGKTLCDRIEAESWEEAEKLTRISEEVVGELISEMEIIQN
jgi:hypothetical protein